MRSGFENASELLVLFCRGRWSLGKWCREGGAGVVSLLLVGFRCPRILADKVWGLSVHGLTGPFVPLPCLHDERDTGCAGPAGWVVESGQGWPRDWRIPGRLVEPGAPVTVASPALGLPRAPVKGLSVCDGLSHQTLSCYLSFQYFWFLELSSVSWGRDLHCSCLPPVLWKAGLKTCAQSELPAAL